MTLASLHEDGWSLRATANDDIEAVMTWFPDAEAVNSWGGPGFRFPFSPDSFREDCKLDQRRDYDEYSLFVYRDNLPAYRCYLSLGFLVRDYPDDAPMPDKCYFLTKRRRE